MTRINNYTLLIFTTRDSLPNYAAVANSEVQEMIDLPSFSMTCQNNDQFNEINNPKTVFDKLTAVLNTRRIETRKGMNLWTTQFIPSIPSPIDAQGFTEGVHIKVIIFPAVIYGIS